MKTRERLGPFDYEKNSPPTDEIGRIKKHIVTFDDGTTYDGEWDEKKNVRDGRGVQTWADGSIYEGYWKNGKSNGRGRLIRGHGHYYDGEWKDDQLHGKGM